MIYYKYNIIQSIIEQHVISNLKELINHHN